MPGYTQAAARTARVLRARVSACGLTLTRNNL